ncbi:MAG TPA: tetratricopeptide repeat protein, partial [Bacteroidota bacterium]|nr:tetratricopeptide repeat protein [Bacteroidota bacterium]
WSILGSFYRALGNVGWLERALASLFVGTVPRGGYEEAEAALRKAIAIAPGIMRHHYELGILYIDMGRKDEARRALEFAATLPVRTAIDRPRLEKIRELLAGPDLR